MAANSRFTSSLNGIPRRSSILRGRVIPKSAARARTRSASYANSSLNVLILQPYRANKWRMRCGFSIIDRVNVSVGRRRARCLDIVVRNTKIEKGAPESPFDLEHCSKTARLSPLHPVEGLFVLLFEPQSSTHCPFCFLVQQNYLTLPKEFVCLASSVPLENSQSVSSKEILACGNEDAIAMTCRSGMRQYIS